MSKDYKNDKGFLAYKRRLDYVEYQRYRRDLIHRDDYFYTGEGEYTTLIWVCVFLLLVVFIIAILSPFFFDPYDDYPYHRDYLKDNTTLI